MTDSTDWQIAAQAYAARVARAEYLAQRAAYKRKTGFRFAPSEYLQSLCAAMGRNDEEGFKAIKMLEGYASAAGV